MSITTAMTLPPLSEMLVPVCVSPAGTIDLLPDFVGYLAPNLRSKSECVVAHTVTTVKDGVTTASVLNPTDPDMILRKGMHLGEFISVNACRPSKK